MSEHQRQSAPGVGRTAFGSRRTPHNARWFAAATLAEEREPGYASRQTLEQAQTNRDQGNAAVQARQAALQAAQSTC